MSSLKILSVNCQGLGNTLKRRDVFDMLKSKNCNIYCIQDTHFTNDIENIVRSMWGYECYFSSVSSNSRGVAILFNNNFECKVLKEKKDINGNYSILDILVENRKITLVCLYGPNTDNPDFFSNIMSVIDDFENEYFVICGDFNLVQNPCIDYCNYVNINNQKAREKVLEFIEERNLIDPYRELFPDVQRYTWRKRNPFKQARLDFFLLTENFLNSLKNCNVLPSYRSDHSMILLDLEFNPFIRGKGLWKFNNSLLYDIDYINTIKQKIQEVKKQYCALVYNMENIDKIDNTDIHFRINCQLLLETLLMEIRGKTVSYSSFKKKQDEKRETNLQNEITQLEERVDEHSINALEAKKHELESLRTQKLKGKLVRSRVQWIQEGEKPTNYFCGLESRNFMSKIIPKVEKENGEIITKQKDILNEVKYFYDNLYKKRDTKSNLSDLKKDLKNLSVPILSSQEKESLEGTITVKEAGEALKKMKNNKTPGTDGFSAEFYKFFWKDLQIFIVNSLNYGAKTGELSVTQKQGIITCLPKGNKPRHFLKNWHPISLLNTVYKIGSAAIANRFKSVLDKLINFDQTGFISGRYIGENIRLIYDILQYTEEHEIPGLLLLIDFEKAFDSISWDFLINVLKFFNFGDSIINWVKVFYNNINSAVIQGGNLSDFFTIGRGCRQGDPLSPYLFILCVEILALKIRGNSDISGIEVTRVEHKLSQFADDTSLILDGSEKSLQESLLELDWFAKISGLNINFTKTQVIWFGSKKYSTDTLCPNRNLSWGETSFKLLGINFDVDLEKIVKINYSERIVQIKNTLNQWSKRNLTVIGRITVIKTLVLPIVNHLIISLPNPSDDIIKRINELIYSYIWNSPIHRVKKDILIKDYLEGGLKMLDLNMFITALKSTWIRRLLQRDSKWQNIFMSNIDKRKLFSCGVDYTCIRQLYMTVNNHFWKDVLRSWEMIIQKERNFTYDSFLSNPLWLNINIKIGHKSVIYQDWFKSGIRFVNDIVDQI